MIFKSLLLYATCQQKVPELVEQYYNIIQDIFDKHANVYKHTITIHPQAPWYNKSIRNQKQLRRKLEKRWRRTKLEVDNQNHLNQCTNVNTICLQLRGTTTVPEC